MQSNQSIDSRRTFAHRNFKRTTSNPPKVWGGYVASVLLYAIVFSLWQVQPVPDSANAIGIFIAAICLFPMALWLARGGKGVPAFELVCIAYLFAFGLPLYIQPNQINILSAPNYFTWDQTFRTLLLSALGISSLIFGYYGAIKIGVLRRLPHIDLPLKPSRRHQFYELAFGFGLLMIVMQAAGGHFHIPALDAIIRLLNSQVSVALILLAYGVYRRQEKSLWKVILIIVVVLSTLLGLASGMLENAIVPLLLLLIVRWEVKRQVPVLWLGAGLLGFVILNSVKMDYRKQAWRGDSMGISEKIDLWIDLSSNSIQKLGNFEEVQAMFRDSMSRFDLLHQFVRVQNLTPSSIPYYEGETYGYFFYGWIPRFIWPDKPIAQQANVQFAVDYKLMTPDQVSSVMIGIGHLPESYANFGLWGLIFVMALQGIFLASVDAILNRPNSEGGKAIYLSLIVFFLNGIGSATAALFMSIIPNAVANAFILRPFSVGWRIRSVNNRLVKGGKRLNR
jgi:hypothetical protein